MDKPKVYVNSIDRKIYNNQEFFDSETDIRNKDYLYVNDNDYHNLSVIEKIEKLLNRNGYIFNVDVSIKTKDKVYNTKIAGKVNNHLITLDNNIISIDDIVDLEIRS